MKGTFYGLGVGPGDPDLITVKSLKILQGADVIVTPTKKMGKPSIAYRIVESHIPQGTEVIEMNFPMISLSEERETLQKQWAENADAIEVMLKDGKDVVFLTLGDPMVFSTYSYIMEFLVERDIEVVTLSGIPPSVTWPPRWGFP